MKKSALFLLILPIQLNWGMFKGTPNPHHTAMSALSIGWYQSTWEDGVHVRFDSAVVEFNEYGSYTNTSDLYILAHEQGHYITAYLECLYINKWIHIHHIKYTQDQFDAMQLELTRRWHKQDDLYDEQTSHSENKEMQARWNKWFVKELAKYGIVWQPS